AVGVLLLAALGGTAWLLIAHQERELRGQVLHRARAALTFGEACREYARETLSPAVQARTRGLVFEANSATFVARGVFAAVRKRMPEYSFREAALNPLNPANRADPEEEALIRHFQADPGLGEVSGYRRGDGGEFFYVARPIPVKQECLKCHGSPAQAPPELVRRYGDRHGYGWKEGEVGAPVIVLGPPGDLRAPQA